MYIYKYYYNKSLICPIIITIYIVENLGTIPMPIVLDLMLLIMRALSGHKTSIDLNEPEYSKERVYTQAGILMFKRMLYTLSYSELKM